MAKIKIKDNKHRERNRRNKLWQALMAAGISISRLEENRENYQLTTTDIAIDQITTPKSKNILRSYGFDPLRPHFLEAKKTIVVKFVDVHIATSTKEAIKTNLETTNPKLEVEDVIHLPTSPKTIKIKFTSVEAAKIAQSEGLTILNQVIPPKNIEEEIYIQLVPCFVCYGYDHKTADCPTPNLRICSECGVEGHTYTECPTPRIKQCINCRKDHRTLAAVCEIRRGLVKKKTQDILSKRKDLRKSKQQNEKPTPEGTASGRQSNINIKNTTEKQHTGSETVAAQQMPLPSNAAAIITSAIIYATYHEVYEPGSYQKALNETYNLNGIQPVNLPVPADPMKFLQALDTNKTSTPTSTNGNVATESPTTDRQEEKPKKKSRKKPSKRARIEPPPPPLEADTDSEVEALLAAAEESAMLEYDEYLLEQEEYNLIEHSKHIRETTGSEPELSSIREDSEDLEETNRELVYKLTPGELSETTESETSRNQPKCEPQHSPAPDSGEFMVWAIRNYQPRSEGRDYVPQELDMKLVGVDRHRPSSCASNDELYRLYDMKRLALVLEDQQDVPFILQMMDEKRIDLTMIRIRFYTPEKFKKMLEGEIPFTWDNK